MKLNVKKLKSTFAIVDVKGKLRHKLALHFNNTPPGPTAQKHMIPITLYGYLDGINGPVKVAAVRNNLRSRVGSDRVERVARLLGLRVVG